MQEEELDFSDQMKELGATKTTQEEDEETSEHVDQTAEQKKAKG